MTSKLLKDLLTLEPFRFQRKGIKFALDHHYSINGDEMGLGKTLQAIATAVKSGEQTLIIVPAYLRLTWEREIRKYLQCPPCIITLNKHQEFYTPIDEQFIITSYSLACSRKTINVCYTAYLFCKKRTQNKHWE